MNKLFSVFFWSILVVVFFLIVLKLFAGTLHQGMESEGSLDGLEVKVNYNSIQIGKKRFFGDVAPYDIVWRAGAGDATEISFSEDCIFGDSKVKAGKYSLWILPRENKKWHAILNKDVSIYGTNYEPSQNYVYYETWPKKLETRQSNLRINLVNQDEKLQLVLRFENEELKIPISKK